MSYYRDKIYKDNQYRSRKDTDVLLEKEISKITLDGIVNKSVNFVLNHQLLNTELWDTFIDQYILKSDSKNGTWKGEYFGKMMRGGVFIYKVNNDKKLYEVLKNACLSLIKTQDELGRICTYSFETEFSSWDMWCRKYVLLGLEYFLEICEEEEDVKEIILDALIKHADYILSKIGNGKKNILDTSEAWGCVNSCTILEPMVKLYNLTGFDRYLEFSNYIKESGGSNVGNLYELALENIKFPYQYPTTKAYEMMSFFDGLAELYSVTKEENLKTAFLNFVNKVIESDYTIIGCAGCTHELFDNSSVTQTSPQPDVVQETCVTVTMMKLFIRALELTGDSKYADLIEKSYYNAMIGAINFNENSKLYWGKEYEIQFDYSPSDDFVKKIHGFTFDSYSPLIKDSRCKKTGGYQLMDDNKAYGCCACIGSLGVATLPLYAVMENDNGLTFNFYTGLNSVYYSPKGKPVNIKVETNYPYGKKVKIYITLEEEENFAIDLRIPSYVKKAYVSEKVVETGKYYRVEKVFKNDVIEIDFDFDVALTELNDKIAITKGVITYAIDNRIEDIDKLASNKIVAYKEINKEFSCQSEIVVSFDNGIDIKMVDYASAGAIYDEGKNKITVWMEQK